MSSSPTQAEARRDRVTRFAHISDLHLCQKPGKSNSVRPDILDVVRGLVRDISAIAELLDFVVLSGDLTDDGHPDTFRQVERLFEGLGLPLYLVAGNHDGPAAFLEYKRGSAFLQRSDISGRSVDQGGIRLVGLDTCIEGATQGALSSETLELVRQELAAGGTSRLVIVMHHPPFAPGLRAYDEICRLEGSEELGRLLRQADAAPVILCGHVHRPYFARWNGAACFATGSPAGHYAGDLPFGDAPLRPTAEPYSYYVHALGADGNHVATIRSVASAAAAGPAT